MESIALRLAFGLGEDAIAYGDFQKAIGDWRKARQQFKNLKFGTVLHRFHDRRDRPVTFLQ